LDGDNALVQAPNTILNGKFLINFRRSPEMSEPFTFDVAYDTSFEQIESLRGRMIAFLSNERRDFVAVFDVTVMDIPDQEKMSLKVDIKYKSNAQQGSLKSKRKNKWICALKAALADIKIYGPSGEPNPKPSTSRYTLVPWELISEQDRQQEAGSHPTPPGGIQEPRIPDSNYNLTDSNIVLVDGGGDVFGEGSELRMRNPSRGFHRPAYSRQGTSATQEGMPMASGISMPHPVYGPGPGVPLPLPQVRDEEIEMHPSSSGAH